MLRVYAYDWGHEGIDGEWIANRANSAGGVSVRYSVWNYKKPVKKYTVYFKAYDGAGELVTCEASRKTVCGAKSADYLSKDSYRNDCVIENAWYSHAIRRIEVDSIEVTYSDGTTEKCQGNYTPTAEDRAGDPEKEKEGCTLAVLVLLSMVSLLIGLISMFAGNDGFGVTMMMIGMALIMFLVFRH